ncbi:hypothetical protein CRG98_034075 [Punica granatum]|uniref:Uncharacterized protein n=1 Tax=Punica granatum TaxID=22663 RepID=A0A2I0INK3_PUNGR|nr:hypothetical protein CRG98_034075 [Punica granatum]
MASSTLIGRVQTRILSRRDPQAHAMARLGSVHLPGGRVMDKREKESPLAWLRPEGRGSTRIGADKPDWQCLDPTGHPVKGRPVWFDLTGFLSGSPPVLGTQGTLLGGGGGRLVPDLSS